MESQRAPLFDEAAKTYPQRISYDEKFFDVASKHLELNPASRLLDIACGTGQLATGFSKYCGDITAIDQSEKMLEWARAEAPANVTLARFDVNRSPVPAFGLFDVVTIGRALRYLDKEPLFAILEQTLKDDGAILICGAGLHKTTPWAAAYAGVLRPFQDKSVSLDSSWRSMFVDSPFRRIGAIQSTSERYFSLDDLLNNALSYRALSAVMRENMRKARRDLADAMQPFLNEDNRLCGSVVLYGHEFRRRKALQRIAPSRPELFALGYSPGEAASRLARTKAVPSAK